MRTTDFERLHHLRAHGILATLFLGVAVALAGCGGGGGSNSGSSSGGLSLRAVWERSAQNAAASARFQAHAFQGSDALPPSVSTVEVRIVRGGIVELRRFVDPTQTREVVIDGLKTGPISVQVLGYDLRVCTA